MVWKCGPTAAAGVFPGQFLVYPAKQRVTLLPRVALAASSVPSSPAAAMQSAHLPWEAAWAGAAARDAGDQSGPGSLCGLHRCFIAVCACPLWHKAPSFPSLCQPGLWLNLVLEGTLERETAIIPLGCSPHDLGCWFLGLGWPKFAVPRKS